MLSASAFGLADNIYLGLDYSGYYKNLIQYFFFSIHTLNDLGDSSNLIGSLSRTMNTEFSRKTNFALK